MNRCHASSDSLQSENPLSATPTLAPIAEFLPYPSRRITIACEYDDRQQWMEKTVADISSRWSPNIVEGGEGRPEGLASGYYVKPSVFADVTNDMVIAHEEIFGPVLCILGYTDLDKAVAIGSEQTSALAPGLLSRGGTYVNEAALNSAQLNLEFTRVTSPVHGLTGVFLCAEEVERNIILITENPAIMPRWDVKQIAGSHFDN